MKREGVSTSKPCNNGKPHLERRWWGLIPPVVFLFLPTISLTVHPRQLHPGGYPQLSMNAYPMQRSSHRSSFCEEEPIERFWLEELNRSDNLNDTMHDDTEFHPTTRWSDQPANTYDPTEENEGANHSSFTDSDREFGLSDEEFEQWLTMELNQPNYAHIQRMYANLFVSAPKCITNWRKRFRGDPILWKRLYKHDKVVKEFIEAVPILDAVSSWIAKSPNVANITILDLASGKGYLSMMLSELLPRDKVDKIVLIDKQWPMCGSMPQPHHIQWDHIYGTKPQENRNVSDGSESYFQSWPIPLHTSKQNLKRSCNKRQIKRLIIDSAPGPVLILAIHLCGTLSLSALDLFHSHPEKILFLAVKPCCLPDMSYAKTNITITNSYNRSYTFAGSDVSAEGKWSGKKWYGPPRWHLQDRFNRWSDHLYRGIDGGTASHKIQRHIRVQTHGGYQNTFVLAERGKKVITDIEYWTHHSRSDP